MLASVVHWAGSVWGVMRRYVYGSIVACFLAGGVAGCTSSQTSTSVTAPISAKCQVQVGSPVTEFTSDGGRGTLAIATTRDCSWSVSTSANWVAVANAGGQGDASVPYTVAANPMAVARAAQIAVSDATLQLSQDAAPCRFTLSASSGSVAAAGGTLTAQLSTVTGCAWSARSDASWLTIPSGASGSATAIITMAAAQNTGAARTAHMTAAGLTYTVTQLAATAPPPVQLSGPVAGLSGQCPTVSFKVGSTTVSTNSGTVYSGGTCNNLSNTKQVTVTGTPQANGSAVATLIVVS